VNYAKAFGRRLKSIREAAGFTQEQVAERTRGDAKYLSALENGRSSPTLDTIMWLAKAMNVPVSDFVLLEGEDSDARSL
jgi:transcriptional regulator with XRE-family HTH domain